MRTVLTNLGRVFGAYLALRLGWRESTLEYRAAAFMRSVELLHLSLVRVYWTRVRTERTKHGK
jgi:hypothetical protein